MGKAENRICMIPLVGWKGYDLLVERQLSNKKSKSWLEVPHCNAAELNSAAASQSLSVVTYNVWFSHLAIFWMKFFIGKWRKCYIQSWWWGKRCQLVEVEVKMDDLDILRIFFSSLVDLGCQNLTQVWFWGRQLRIKQKRTMEKTQHLCGVSHQNSGDHHVCVSIFENSKGSRNTPISSWFRRMELQKVHRTKSCHQIFNNFSPSKPATVVYWNKTCYVPAPHFSISCSTEVTSDRSPVGALSWQFRRGLNFGKSQAVVGNRGWMEMLMSKHFLLMKKIIHSKQAFMNIYTYT